MPACKKPLRTYAGVSRACFAWLCARVRVCHGQKTMAHRCLPSFASYLRLNVGDRRRPVRHNHGGIATFGKLLNRVCVGVGGCVQIHARLRRTYSERTQHHIHSYARTYTAHACAMYTHTQHLFERVEVLSDQHHMHHLRGIHSARVFHGVDAVAETIGDRVSHFCGAHAGAVCVIARVYVCVRERARMRTRLTERC